MGVQKVAPWSVDSAVTKRTPALFGKASFQASDFEVPAGIQVMDMGNLFGGRRGGGL